MPSLFSRSRTTSTAKKSTTLHPDHSYGAGPFEEFGRVASPHSQHGELATTSKRDKKRAKDLEKRSKTLPNNSELVPELSFPEGAFLPLSLERPRNENGATEVPKDHDYGYLSYERHVVLGLEQVERLVEVVCEELETRGGVTTPFIFCNSALDISSNSIKRLIKSFLSTCEPSSIRDAQAAEARWRDEAKFAGPHELGMCLRWGLARVIRSVGGQDVRGLVSWEHYVGFRDSEIAQGYPPLHFATNFIPDLAPPLQAIIIRLLSLLTRIVANSTSSGHTPPSLSPLFGPLFFGLGPPTLAFHHAYVHYLRAVNAMDHIILAFIRWQDAPRMSVSSTTGVPTVSASASSLGVPLRLKEWIKGYPSMLPFLEQKNPQPRQGVRTVRVVSVRRNVRMYSPDLVKSASTWANRPGATSLTNGFAASKEWQRIAPPTLKLPPRYSEAYKKRMDMPPNFNPDIGSAASSVSSTASSSSYLSTSTTATSLDPDGFGVGAREGEDRFRSLTDLKWGEFESSGFGGLGDAKKLQFDLTESARQNRTVKRETLSWNAFTSDGFSRMDAPLSATLQFSTPITNTISQLPAQNAEIHRKLKKTQKALPSFGWDTEPVLGSEEVIEESFVDVFCDLIYGSGWMDLERGEELNRDCNWALVEYKALPASRSTISGTQDPRTSATLILFEEFVPLEYRQQLALGPSRRTRMPSLFSASSKKQWKQAPTLNGRPYVVGAVPASPSIREVEFEGLLNNTSTKVISVNSKNTTARIQSSVSTIPTAPVPAPPVPAVRKPSVPLLKTPEPEPSPRLPPPPKSEELHSDTTQSHSGLREKKSRFKLPVSPVNRKSMIPAEYSQVDFETRMASYSDDEHNRDLDEPENIKQKRRESRDDAWVDILVGSQARHLGGQDADRRHGIQPRRSDPDMASLEVAQVLAAVKNRSPSPTSASDRVDRDPGMDQHFGDYDVDEVETMPRQSSSHEHGDGEESDAQLAYEDSVGHGTEEDETPEAIRQARIMAARRVGYFDMHPERRRMIPSMVEEDPRIKLAEEDSEDEDDTPSQSLRPLPVPPPAHAVPVQFPTISMKAALPPAPITPPSPANPAEGKVASKTAALIEMYRERERGAIPAVPTTSPPVPPATIVPSRLPVRALPVPVPVVSAPSPKVATASLVPSIETTLEMPRIPLEETGRNSPARYVHGAPLHNVIEEEEEG